MAAGEAGDTSRPARCLSNISVKRMLWSLCVRNGCGSLPFRQGADIWGWEGRNMVSPGDSRVGLKSIASLLPIPLATHAVRPLHRGSSQL